MVLSIHAFGRGWMLHVKLFFYSSCIALSFHTTRKNCSTLIHSFGRGLILYLYIHTFLSRIPSIILHAFLIPNFRKFHSTIHSFLEGVISLYFSIVSSVIVHCSINPCFWERVDVTCQFFFFHPALLCYSMLLGENVIRPVSSLLKGLISLYFSMVSPIIFHCSINPCFWERVDVACQTFHLSSYIALSFHTTRKKLLYPHALLW